MASSRAISSRRQSKGFAAGVSAAASAAAGRLTKTGAHAPVSTGASAASRSMQSTTAIGLSVRRAALDYREPPRKIQARVD